jgi:signal transduction histidine kinase
MELWSLVESLLGKDRVDALVPGRVLAVDDDTGNLVVLEELLLDHYKVTTTTSPAQALQLVRATEFDMVITDQRMPDITGVQFLRQVRELYPNTVRIIISAYSDAKAMLDAINLGEVYRFVLKPWNATEVMGIVKQGLEYRLSILAIRRLVEALHRKSSELTRTLDELRLTQDKLVQSARLATVGQLTSSLVKELKNHVTGVKMLADTVQEARLPEELREFVAVGVNSAQNLFELVSNLGRFSTDSAWRLRRSRCSVLRILQEAVGIVNLDERARHAGISCSVDDGTPQVVVDAEKIRHLVVNLLTNGIEAIPEGGRVGVHAAVDADGMLTIAVRDNGRGIPPELLQRAWDPFVSTRKDGLGLGLEICRRVAEAHGGRLDIQSTPGAGTTVKVILPAEPPMIE